MEIHATEKGLRLFDAYREVFFFNFIPRTGYNMTGVNKSFDGEGKTRSYDKTYDFSLAQTDGTHLYMLVPLITFLRILYPEYISSHLTEKALFYMPLVHELGELDGGDIADDGRRDEKTKDAEEAAFALSFFERVCDTDESRLVMTNNVGDFFKHFPVADNLESCYYKCLDKGEAIFSNLVYEGIWYDPCDTSRLVEPDYPGAVYRGGSVRYKRKVFRHGKPEYTGISDKEKWCNTITKSDIPSENWFLGFLMNNYQNPFMPLFVELVQSGFKRIHGREMDWVNTCFDWNTKDGNIARIKIPTFH